MGLLDWLKGKREPKPTFTDEQVQGVIRMAVADAAAAAASAARRASEAGQDEDAVVCAAIKAACMELGGAVFPGSSDQEVRDYLRLTHPDSRRAIFQAAQVALAEGFGDDWQTEFLRYAAMVGEPVMVIRRVPERKPSQKKKARPPAPAAPARHKLRLPPMGAEFLVAEFTPAEEPAGAGAGRFWEAIECSKRDESEKAEAAFLEAVGAGLPPTCEAYANCEIGKLALAKSQLEQGIDYLLRCLGAERKSEGATFDAAIRLQVIYAEAGRIEEANALAKLAAAANRRGLALTGTAEEKIRDLVRSGSARLGAQRAPARKAPQPGTLQQELRALRDKFSALPGTFPTPVQVVRIGSGPETLRVIPRVCEDAIRALDQGLDVNNLPIDKSGVANGLKRLVRDARQDTGLVMTLLSAAGVHRYGQYLDELESVANRITSGLSKTDAAGMS
jgi:tetratricopeptide (TPR) repeat protein